MGEVEALPKWMLRKYAQIWKIFKEDRFTADNLVEKLKEDKEIILVLISRLRQKGWLITEQDEEDQRRRKYKLRPMKEMLELIA